MAARDVAAQGAGLLHRIDRLVLVGRGLDAQLLQPGKKVLRSCRHRLNLSGSGAVGQRLLVFSGCFYCICEGLAQ